MLSRNAIGIEETLSVIDEVLTPSKDESVVDWVEENVELPTGNITGKVQMRYIPYGREILERFGDKKTRHLVMCFATQSAKSTLLILGMLYKIARDAEDAMWVMGNADQARDFNKERFMPFVQLCQAVYDLVPRTSRGAVNKNLWGFMAQHYLSMVLNFVGAGSNTNLSSRPRGLIVMDEVDKYYSELKFDAGTIELAEERQKTFNFPLSVKASSPTLANRMIWTEYRKSDQRQYWLPCPRCEREILLKFKIVSPVHGDCGLRWWHENEEEAKTDKRWDMKKVRANAFYKCQECAGKIHSFERDSMLEEGEWKAQNHLAEEGRFGYHINSLYSILGPETSLGNIAIKFLLAKGNRGELQNFFNGWLAEPWDESMAYEHKEIKLEIFSNADIPIDGSVPIMGVDVQEGHYWVVIRRFAPPTTSRPHGESWLLYGDRVETEDQLKEIQEEYHVEGRDVLCDMAHRPNQVARMIIKNGWRGVWGSPNVKKFAWMIDGKKVYRPYSEPQFRDPMLGTKLENRTPQRAMYVNFAKDEMLDMVSTLRHTNPNIWHVSANVSNRYQRQLDSRVKTMMEHPKTGRPEWIWKEIHHETHMGDGETFVTIGALIRGLIIPPNEKSQTETA